MADRSATAALRKSSLASAGLLPAGLLLAMSVAGAAAPTSDWVSIGKINDGTQETFIDTQSIRIDGDLRRGWLKLVLAPHTLIGVAGGPEKWIDHELRREAFRCKDEYHRTEAVVTFYDDGTSIPTPPKTLASTWVPVPPETAASAVMAFICGWTKPH